MSEELLLEQGGQIEDDSAKEQSDDDGGQQAATAVNEKTFTEADVEKLITELTEKHASDTQKAIEDALHKAKLTKDELATLEKEQKAKELDEREKSLTLRELQADTIKLLAEKQLPSEILDMVIADNTENTGKRIEAFKAVFDKAVQAEVTKRIAGKTPPSGSNKKEASGVSSFLKTIHDNQAKRN